MDTNPQAPSALHVERHERHIRKKECRFFEEEKILKPSHFATIREFRPMPTTPRAMRHFEKVDKRGERKASRTLSFSQTFSFSQTVSLPPKAERVGVNTCHCQPGGGETVLDCTTVTDTQLRPRARDITLLRANMSFPSRFSDRNWSTRVSIQLRSGLG